MSFEDKKIAFIGAGVMGGTMISGLVNSQLVIPTQVIASDPNEVRLQELHDTLGINTTTSNVEAVADADIIVIGVKPQQIETALHEIRGRVDSAGLILSIVAGTKIRDIVEDLHNSRVVRSIPNTPAQIGEGITVWTATYEVMDDYKILAQQILSAMGEELYVDDEHYMDMATGLSGSGPGYVFLIIESMIDAGVRMGFSRAHAEKLTLQTIKGSVLYAQQSGIHPTLLRNQVTSPGGTTAAGLHRMEKLGLRSAIGDGIWAAYQRSVELGESDD
ncbi:MAG: pyrroline-5-carboxylate reductase [Phototrophicaceae bacterium]